MTRVPGLALFFVLATTLAAPAASAQQKPPLAPPTQLAPTVLSDAMIAAHLGDFDSLFRAWLRPMLSNAGFISVNPPDSDAVVEMIRDGFERYCRANC